MKYVHLLHMIRFVVKLIVSGPFRFKFVPKLRIFRQIPQDTKEGRLVF